jgi:hypothetical protein
MRGYESAPHHRMRAGHYVQRHRPEVPDSGLERVNASHMTEAGRSGQEALQLAQKDPNAPATAKELLEEHMKATDDKGVLLARREQYSKNRRDEDALPSEEAALAASKAEEVYREFGSTAPTPLNGEDGRSYRLRICDELRKHSSRHANISLRALAGMDEAGFSAIEGEILEDAMAAARVFAPPFQLRERVTRVDGVPVPVTEFAGDPRVWLARFMHPGRSVAKMRGPGGVEITPNRSYVGKVAL